MLAIMRTRIKICCIASIDEAQLAIAAGADALSMMPAYAPHVHAFLLDAGRSHDWAISARFVRASPVPVFLAAGLDDSNVAGALRQVRPYGIDLCSRVRTDGQLDIMKLALLTSAVREADALLYAEG